MNKTQNFTDSYPSNVKLFDYLVRINESFDLIAKNLNIGGRNSRLYFVDGFAKDETLEKMSEFLLSVNPNDIENYKTADEFCNNCISYIEADIEKDINKCITSLLSGTIVLLVEGYNSAFLIDARTYPVRGVEEPDDDKVLRGSRDGFVETVVFNTALIRRRIRTADLTMEMLQVGEKSHSDIVLCYLDSRVDKKLLNNLRKRINNIDINALTFNQESLTECLCKASWYNPCPRARYTERPDTAAANILEGKIIIIVDNSPAVLIVPTTFFDFVQDTNDFYFSPLVGTYLRLVRMVIFIITLFLTPVWYLLIKNPEVIPSSMDFILIDTPVKVPVIFQLLLIEFVIDGLKLASLNTPSSLSNSFSVLGALILGDFAVTAQWLVPEVVLYMAFVAIANFAQPSFELGYAFKLFRMFILICTALFNYIGFFGSIIIMCVIIVNTKTISQKSYLYPLFPFNYHDFSHLFFRRKLDDSNS